MTNATDVDRLLTQAAAGRSDALAQLVPLVYNELQRLAHHILRSEPHSTLQTTAVVHEAFLKLVRADARTHWESRSHFMCVAAKAMRSVLVDHARSRQAQKRGGGAQRVLFDEAVQALGQQGVDMLDLDEMLDALSQQDARKGRLVELRFFAGLTMAEAAQTLDISVPTAEREWRVARAWLTSRLREMPGAGS